MKYLQTYNESIRQYLKPKSKEEVEELLKNDKRPLFWEYGYTEKQAKSIIKEYSEEFNKNFSESSEISSNDPYVTIKWYYMWNAPNDIEPTLALSLTLQKNSYWVSFTDDRKYSPKRIKRFITSGGKDALGTGELRFSKEFYYLDHALQFLKDCNVDTSGVTKT